jgi:hypothetical protein
MTSVKCPRCRVRLASVWSTSPKVGLQSASYDGVVYARYDQSHFWWENLWSCQRCALDLGSDTKLGQLIQWAEHAGQREVTFGQVFPSDPPVKAEATGVELRAPVTTDAIDR